MKIISTKSAPAPAAAYSQAIEAGGLVFTAGQLGADPQNGALAPDIAAQTARCLENIAAILHEAGLGLTHVAKVTIFLTDMAHYAAMNEVYERYVGGSKPARTTVAVAALPRGALIEVDAIAVRPGA
ncbi:MAG: Rid family detoxifying hydrolase [Candidatus Eremiobacteraeota bacterium]|nr:Rid family detoxifying hydrolase [Candidatus Eremiobacteraeota bacterium]